jgi:hypothetical protein
MFKMPFDLDNHASTDLQDHPLGSLAREDLDLIVELVLKSGSLKDLATVYGVSYPTIRGRLDKVIARLTAAKQGKKVDPLTELLAAMVERGELSASGARSIRDTARKATQGGSS